MGVRAVYGSIAIQNAVRVQRGIIAISALLCSAPLGSRATARGQLCRDRCTRNVQLPESFMAARSMYGSIAIQYPLDSRADEHHVLYANY